MAGFCLLWSVYETCGEGWFDAMGHKVEEEKTLRNHPETGM